MTESERVESADPDGKAHRSASAIERHALGVGLIVFALLFAYLLLSFWPSGFDADKTLGSSLQPIRLLGTNINLEGITADIQLLIIVMLSGGIGSFIHTATSFGDFVGNGRLSSNWVWWYVLKPFIGMSLALVFYLVVRGGFLSGTVTTGQLNVYGLTALAGLAGMFSKQATDKLSEVFTALFRTAPGSGDAKRADDLTNPVPTLSDVDPMRIEPATQNLVIAVKGSHFVRASAVRVNGVNRETQYKDATQLTAKLLPTDVAAAGELQIAVFNPAPGGGLSTPLQIRVATGPLVDGGVTEEALDGCDVDMTADATPDEDLPAARGGVSRP